MGAVKYGFHIIAKGMLLAELALAAPWLLKKPVFYFTEAIIDWILTKIITSSETGIFFLYIDMRVGDQKDAFVSAVTEHINAKPEDKANAEKKLIDAFRTFAKFKS